MHKIFTKYLLFIIDIWKIIIIIIINKQTDHTTAHNNRRLNNGAYHDQHGKPGIIL